MFSVSRVGRSDPFPGYRGSSGERRLPAIVLPLENGRQVAIRRADGSLLSLSDLPGPDERWTRRRKQIVAECVATGLITSASACVRYRLSPQELAEWGAMAEAGRRAVPATWQDRPRPLAGQVVRSGPLEIDLARRRLRMNGRAGALSGAEWHLLAALAEAGGGVVSNAMLMSTITSDPGRAPNGKIIDVLMCRIRGKLGDCSARIVTVWGRGYQLQDARPEGVAA